MRGPSYTQRGIQRLFPGNPTRAIARVVCAELYNPSNRMPALLNPSSLRMSSRAIIGKLSPIGWSHQIKQYSHTEDSPFTMEFYYSAIGARRLAGGTILEAQEAYQWYMSFTLPRDLGVSPPPMLIVWPNTLTMAVAVEQVDVGIDRWDSDLQIRTQTISVTCSELRQTFRTSRAMNVFGFSGEGHSLQRGAGGGFVLGSTGAGVNLGKSGDAR